MSLKLVPSVTPGRPIDKRITADYLATRNLKGEAFVPGIDIDLVDAINDALTDLNANIAAGATILSLTNTQRLALTPDHVVVVKVTNGPLLTYTPGIGWRDAFNNDPDALIPPGPPTDTGVY
ncbi:hypothetical protein [Deinococcus ruber]|uniref:Uncharacterized protein n=1 Tax=Deinococcus ruber TaxID=1848197 RepID=A0A918BZQ6_9DEIO|nr:hypothetical protein [Deinococcus ruber]GGR00361.1 hypothetical protein GCM10008957_11430 [Deinococcus ruber]